MMEFNAFPLASGDPLDIFARGVSGDAVGRHHVGSRELLNVAHGKGKLLLAHRQTKSVWG